MASNAFSGVGSSFLIGDGASVENFTPIPEITSVSHSGMSAEEIDVTSIDSVGGFREFITGFKDAGTVTLEANFTRTGYDDFLTDFVNNTIRNYRYILGDTNGTQFDFAARISNLGEPSITPNDAVSFSVTLRKTGQPVMST